MWDRDFASGWSMRHYCFLDWPVYARIGWHWVRYPMRENQSPSHTKTQHSKMCSNTSLSIQSRTSQLDFLPTPFSFPSMSNEYDRRHRLLKSHQAWFVGSPEIGRLSISWGDCQILESSENSIGCSAPLKRTENSFTSLRFFLSLPGAKWFQLMKTQRT